MSAGTLTLVSVPPAALLYVAVMLVGDGPDHVPARRCADAVPGAHLCRHAVLGGDRQCAPFHRPCPRPLRARGARRDHPAAARIRGVGIGRPVGTRQQPDARQHLDRDWPTRSAARSTRWSAGRAPNCSIPGPAREPVFDRHAHPVRPFRSRRRRSATSPSRRLHTGRWWSLSGKPIRDRDGVLLGWRGVGSDITDLRLSGDDAVRAARRDPLTGLANRLLVRELLEETLLMQSARRDARAGCCWSTSTASSWSTTRWAMRSATNCWSKSRGGSKRSVGDGGRVGRLGGDEFAIVWHGDASRETLVRASPNGSSPTCRTSFTIGAACLHVGATIGIACGPGDGAREEQLMRAADLALYRAKDAGRGGYRLFRAPHVRRGRGSPPARE